MLGRVIRIAAPVGLGCALTIAGAAALGDIPDSNTGEISACYQNGGNDSGPAPGTLRVIDAQAGDTCSPAETPLSWNQTGPAGPPGPEGAQGPSTAFVLRHGAVNLCEYCGKRIIDQSLPSGRYLYGLKVLLENFGSAPATVVCALTPVEPSFGDDGVARLAAKDDPGGVQTISLQGYTQVGIKVYAECNLTRPGNVSADSIVLTALQVGRINPPRLKGIR